MSEGNDQTEDDGALGPDEVYCTSCGEVIKAEAEICPKCGVRQKEPEGDEASDLVESRKHELQKIARKDKTTVAIVSFLVPFIGYVMVGKIGLALLNIFTLNYFLLGFIIVPFHTYSMIGNAREELERHGEKW